MTSAIIAAPQGTFRARVAQAQDTASAAPDPRIIDRHRYRLERTECSWTWANDLLYGLDRDYCRGGRLTGHGTLKRRCCSCARWIPPQDLVQELCTDCRTKAPPDQTVKRAAGDNTTLQYVKYLGSDEVEYVGSEPHPQWVPDEVADDSSGVGDVLDAMEAVNQQLREDPLPTEDVEILASAIADLAVTGDLQTYLDRTGETELARQQRERYGASREIAV